MSKELCLKLLDIDSSIWEPRN